MKTFSTSCTVFCKPIGLSNLGFRSFVIKMQSNRIDDVCTYDFVRALFQVRAYFRRSALYRPRRILEGKITSLIRTREDIDGRICSN